MKLRNGILAGLVLSVLTIVFTFGTILLSFRRLLIYLGIVLLWYGYVAIRRTQPRTAEDALVLQRGLKWGVAIACSFAGMVLGMLASSEFTALAVVVAVLLPFAAGASGAIQSGRVLVGARVGLWSGVIGGLLGFLVIAAGGYLRAWLSGAGVFAFMASTEYVSLQVATYVLIFYGPIFSPIAATIGGWVGIQLEKTGRLSPVT
jgi:hypothetical protein